MKALPLVTLTTDFGLRDTFVGEMKGAALDIAPELTFVDLTHEVPPHDVRAGAALLGRGYAAFPPGTIHVAVVDPGVGTARRGIVVRTARHFFVAPDNGLLTRVLQRDPPQCAHVLVEPHLRRESVSSTFEGRDVFAPAAAWLARGTRPEDFGPAAGEPVLLSLGETRLDPARESPTRVLLVDRFGNVTLDVTREALGPFAHSGRLRVRTAGGTVSTLHRTYGDAAGPDPFMLFDSAGYLELAVREGRADRALGLAVGDRVWLRVGG